MNDKLSLKNLLSAIIRRYVFIGKAIKDWDEQDKSVYVPNEYGKEFDRLQKKYFKKRGYDPYEEYLNKIPMRLIPPDDIQTWNMK